MKISVAVLAALSVTMISQHAQATTVAIPDLAPNSFTYIGNGDASVTYDDVVFTQSAELGNPNLYNVGSNYVGDGTAGAVLSSQEQTVGLANIEISLPSASKDVSIDFGTFDSSPVTFTLSNGAVFTEPGTSSGYSTPGVFSVAELDPISSILITNSYVLSVQSVTFGTVSAAPEPSTWALMMLGIGGVGYAFRRAKKDYGLTFARALSA